MKEINFPFLFLLIHLAADSPVLPSEGELVNLKLHGHLTHTHTHTAPKYINVFLSFFMYLYTCKCNFLFLLCELYCSLHKKPPYVEMCFF